MANEFHLPDIGEGIAEAEIAKWLVQEGASVKEDQDLVEIETDKAIVKLPSPQNGKIAKLHAKEGDTLVVTETAEGVVLSPADEEHRKQMELAEDIMRRYRNTLRELAK